MPACTCRSGFYSFVQHLPRCCFSIGGHDLPVHEARHPLAPGCPRFIHTFLVRPSRSELKQDSRLTGVRFLAGPPWQVSRTGPYVYRSMRAECAGPWCTTLYTRTRYTRSIRPAIQLN